MDGASTLAWEVAVVNEPIILVIWAPQAAPIAWKVEELLGSGRPSELQGIIPEGLTKEEDRLPKGFKGQMDEKVTGDCLTATPLPPGSPPLGIEWVSSCKRGGGGWFDGPVDEAGAGSVSEGFDDNGGRGKTNDSGGGSLDVGEFTANFMK